MSKTMPALKDKEPQPSMSGGGKKPPRKTKIGTGGSGERFPNSEGKGPDKYRGMSNRKDDEKKKEKTNPKPTSSYIQRAQKKK